MPSIATLAVSVTARTAKFAKGMKRAGKSLKAFGAKVATTSLRLAKFAGAMAIAAGVGLTFMVKRTLDAIDAVAKVSQRLGVATEELLGFHHAAKLAGVRTQTFDMALQRMTRRVSEAALGTGEAQDAIKELGLDARALNLAGPASAMAQIAERLQAVGTQSDRVRLAFKLFDSEGVALVQMFSRANKSFREATEEVKRLGGSFSDIDAGLVEQAVDAFARLRLVLAGGARKFTIGIAPFITELSNKFIELGVDANHAGLTAVNAFRGMAQATAAAARFFDLFVAEVEIRIADLRLVFQGLVDTWRRTIALINVGFRLLGVENPRLEKLETLMHGLGSAIGEEITEALEKAAKAMVRFRDAATSRDVTQWFDDIIDKARAAAKEAAKLRDTQGDLIDRLNLAQATKAAAKGVRVAEFKQISLARFAVGGLGGAKRPQIVKDPQLVITNRILAAMKAEQIRFGLLGALTGV